MEAIILLDQTKTMAAIEIIIMLVVAAVIGYLTAWIYYRSVYTKKINELQKEIDNLRSRIVRLNADSSDLKKQIEKLEGELTQMKEENRKKSQTK